MSVDYPVVQRSVRTLVAVSLAAVAALALMLVLSDDAAATHYRYGTLSWEPTENANEVCFSGSQAWRASYFGSPAVGAIVGGESSIATGAGSVQQYMKVVSYNPVNDWMFVQLVDSTGDPCIRYTYPSPNNGGQPWVATWGSCCRISSISSGNYHVNNPDQSESLKTLVDLASGNSSPKTNLPPINPCPINALCTIAVPFVDPDDDAVSFRLATTSEAGDGGYTPPGPPDAPNGATIHATTGLISWDTTGATNNPAYHTLYSMQVVLEDGTTQVPLDFFIELIPAGRETPYWDPSSNCGGTLDVGTNGLVTFNVKALNDDAVRTMNIYHLGLPPAATFTQDGPANPVTGTFTWTPGAGDAGSHLVIFTAVDDLGYSSPNCAITVKVVSHPPPKFFNSPCGFANELVSVEAVPIAFNVYANTTNLSRTVTLSLLSGPAGLVFSPGPAGNPTSGAASWASPVLGAHLVKILATDSGGLTAVCVVFLDVVRPDTESHALGFWAGNTVPVNVEYRSSGADASGDGSDGGIHHVIDIPSQGIRVESLEEQAETSITSPTTSATGYTETSYVSLQGGLVKIWGLTNEATLTWNGATKTFFFDDTREIARLVVGIVEVPVDDSQGPVDVPLPTGGFVRLFERSVESDANGAVLRSNLVHVFANSPVYGKQEVILGSLLLQAATVLEPIAQERVILEQDDAGCGCDAPGTTAGAIPIATGLHDGSVPGNDADDMFAIELKHGDTLNLALDGAQRSEVIGGSTFTPDPPLPPAIAPPTIGVPIVQGDAGNSFFLALYDPTGTQREFSNTLLAQVPNKIELNADLDGTWHVLVRRTSPNELKGDNYTLAVSVTPTPLSPQNDALTLADAPGTCGAPGTALIDDGITTGVVRDDDFVDVYRFTAVFGDLIAAVLKPGETIDGVNMALRLYDRNCAQLGYFDTFGAQGSGLKGAPDALTELPSLYTGNYYVAVERVNGVGNYYLDLNVVDPQPTLLPNGDAGNGADAPESYQNAPIEEGPAFQGQLHEGDTGDAYRINFQAGREVFLVVSGQALNYFDVSLYAPGGGQIGQYASAAGTVVYRFIPAAGGLFGLEIHQNVGGGDYVVAFAQRPPV